jgi:hypothetical protein
MGMIVRAPGIAPELETPAGQQALLSPHFNNIKPFDPEFTEISAVAAQHTGKQHDEISAATIHLRLI